MSRRRALIACLTVLVPVAGTAADYEPPGDERAASLQQAELRYLAAADDPLSALAAARRLPADAARESERAELDLLLGGHQVAYGLLPDAAERYRRSLDYRIAAERRNRAWFELARAWLRNGHYARAEEALDRVHGDMPAELDGRKPELLARVLIAQGRFEEAAETLRAVERDLDPYARYNLGVALVRAGRIDEGAGELNAVGQMRTQDRAGLALRDQANLVLGFAYLEIGQGATARALFQRIRLDGPAADKALLGLGWAELAPDGTPQKHTVLKEIACREDPARLLPDTLPVLRRMPREACGPPRMFRDTDRFRTKDGGETREQRYRRALVPWLELLHRDPDAGAVQEAWMAAPYAYAEIGAGDRALGYYDRAIRVLEDERAEMDVVVQRLEAPAEADSDLPPGVEPDLSWFARRWDLPPDIATPYLHDTVADAGFRSAAADLRDLIALDDHLLTREEELRELQSALQGRRTALFRAGVAPPEPLQRQENRVRALQKRLAALQIRIAEAITAYGDHLRQRARSAAREQAQYLDTYLTNTRLGHASLLDRLGGDATAPAGTSTP